MPTPASSSPALIAPRGNWGDVFVQTTDSMVVPASSLVSFAATRILVSPKLLSRPDSFRRLGNLLAGLLVWAGLLTPLRAQTPAGSDNSPELEIRSVTVNDRTASLRRDEVNLGSSPENIFFNFG